MLWQAESARSFEAFTFNHMVYERKVGISMGTDWETL